MVDSDVLSHRDARKALMLYHFDHLKRWPGGPAFAKRYGVSRQWVAWFLSKERPERYAQLRAKRGRRPRDP